MSLFCCLSVACGLGSVPPSPGEEDRPSDDDDPVAGAPDGGAPDDDDDDGDEDRFDTAAQMLEAFGDCMRYEDWLSSGLIELPQQLARDDDGTGENECSSCHTADGPGAYLGLDPELTFMRQRDRPTLYKMAMAILSENGEPLDVVPNHRYEDKGQEGTQHPDFVLDPALVQGLTEFFDRTYTRFQIEEGACVRVDPT
ncbi:MAG TPA: hypothetical protein VMZ28_22715 [Kofleriaceae bacterium]|nr:hypothetical protein [Kofleriaceae bacterium]